ncbi:MAG: 50S ribosomal protein L10 [bacterium]|nr:50S ribosomal protein L10 [bacterium]
MAITKEKKEKILAKLESIKNSAKTLVFVGFRGITVGDQTAMRAKLREEGVGYFVAKKTLIRRAFDGAFKGEAPALEGEVALAYLTAQAGTDNLAPAQNIRAFEKQYADQVLILGGVFEGAYKDKEAMGIIASIPAMPVLRGMFLNVINSPIQGLVVGLNAIADKKSA